MLEARAEVARLGYPQREIELVIDLAQHYQARGHYQRAVQFYQNIIPKAETLMDQQYLLS